jgi:hypothetical protein
MTKTSTTPTATDPTPAKEETPATEATFPRVDFGQHYSLYRGKPGEYFVFGGPGHEGIMFFDNYPDARAYFRKVLLDPKVRHASEVGKRAAAFNKAIEIQKAYYARLFEDEGPKADLTKEWFHAVNMGMIVLVLGNCFQISQDGLLSNSSSIEEVMSQCDYMENHREAKPKESAAKGGLTNEDLQELLAGLTLGEADPGKDQLP